MEGEFRGLELPFDAIRRADQLNKASFHTWTGQIRPAGRWSFSPNQAARVTN